MVKSAVCCLILGVLAAPGQESTGPIAIYTQFQFEPSNPVVEAVREELASLISPVAAPFEWRTISEAGIGQFQELAVVTFRGKCDASEPLPLRMESGALGWTHTTGGEILPFCEVDCDRIRGFVRRVLFSLQLKERERAFGRAIGRVLAHELYHAFTKTKHHGLSGVAKSTYTVDELMQDEFHFVEADAELLGMFLADNRPSAKQDPARRRGASLFAKSGCAGCHGAKGEGSKRGPAIRARGLSSDAPALAARLKSQKSRMYERAQDSRARWSSLGEGDIQALLTFLKSVAD